MTLQEELIRNRTNGLHFVDIVRFGEFVERGEQRGQQLHHTRRSGRSRIFGEAFDV